MEQEKIWDTIAEKWAEFRNKPVEEVVNFLEGKKGKVLDLGCGSGRNFLKREGLEFYGVDFSEELLKFARKKDYVEIQKGFSYAIVYDDKFFDYVVCARVLHCVDSDLKRKKSLKEIYRVLKSGGEAMISVWGRGQDRIKNREKESRVPWTVGDEKVERYTYIYDTEELKADLEEVGFEILSVEVGENIVVTVRKE